MKFGVADLISRQPLPHHGACIPFSQPPPSNLFFPLPSALPPPSGRSLESVQSAALLWRNHTPSDVTTHVASTSPRGQRPPSVLLFLFFPLVFSVNYSRLSIERIERICEFVESVPVVRIRARINEYRCFFFFFLEKGGLRGLVVTGNLFNLFVKIVYKQSGNIGKYEVRDF